MRLPHDGTNFGIGTLGTFFHDALAATCKSRCGGRPIRPAPTQHTIDTRRHHMFPSLKPAEMERLRGLGKLLEDVGRPVAYDRLVVRFRSSPPLAARSA